MNNNDNNSSYHPVLLMAGSTTKRIQQIVAGDILMGITGNPVRVTNCERIDNTDVQEHILTRLFQLNVALNNDSLVLTENQLVFVQNDVWIWVHLVEEEETEVSTFTCNISTIKRLNHEGSSIHQVFEYMVRKKRPFKPPWNGQTPVKEMLKVKPGTMLQDNECTWWKN